MMKTDAQFSVGADTSAAGKAISKLAKETSDALSAIGNAFLGVKAFDSIGRSVAEVLSSFTSPAAELENTAAALGVLMGDSSGAERLTSALQHLATNGIVSFEELVGSAKTLSSVMSDDSAIAHYVGVFADIAAASDMTAGELASMVARMDDASQAPARLATLSAKGVPIVETLAAVLRKSTDEIQAMAKAGELTGSQLMAAFERMTQEGERFHHMNATMSSTTEGSWNTLKASVTECMAELGKPINDALRPMLQDLSNWAQQHGGEMQALGQSIGRAMQTLASAAGAVAPVLAGLTGNVHTLTLALSLLTANMGKRVIVGACAGMVGAFKTVGIALRDFRAQVVLTGSFWGTAWAGMVTVTKAACLQIKGALISTGIGAAVWALGEGLAYLYEKFADVEDAELGGVDAASAEEAAKAAQESMRNAQLEMEAREKSLQLARKQTQEAEEAARAAKERLRTMEDMARSRESSDFERRMNAIRDGLGGAQEVIRERLKRIGAPDVASLQNERVGLERESNPTAEQLARYKDVCAALDAIAKEHEHISKTAQDAARQQIEAQKRVAEEEVRYQQQLAARRLSEKSLAQQQRGLTQQAETLGVRGKVGTGSIGERISELNGLDGGHEREIKQLQELRERWQELIERKKQYKETRTAERVEMRAQALELSGNQRGADKLREEETIRKRINALTEEGMGKEQAQQQALAESQMRRLKEMKQAYASMGVTTVSGYRGNVGGGLHQGIRIDYQREALRQGYTILSDIRRILQSGLKINGSINTTATLG